MVTRWHAYRHRITHHISDPPTGNSVTVRGSYQVTKPSIIIKRQLSTRCQHENVTFTACDGNTISIYEIQHIISELDTSSLDATQRTTRRCNRVINIIYHNNKVTIKPREGPVQFTLQAYHRLLNRTLTAVHVHCSYLAIH